MTLVKHYLNTILPSSTKGLTQKMLNIAYDTSFGDQKENFLHFVTIK